MSLDAGIDTHEPPLMTWPTRVRKYAKLHFEKGRRLCMTPPPDLAINSRVYVASDPTQELGESPEPHFCEPIPNLDVVCMPWAMEALGYVCM